jgi:prepilin-type N-terminal cleavage/methylation domain-containing protein
MNKRFKRKNQGYSLPELIIVIAIIMILSAMSLVTFRSVENAKYKQSVSTFESELTTLRSSTMAQDSSMAMLLYYHEHTSTDGDNNKSGYYIKRGYVDSSGDFHPLSQDAGENTPPSDNANLLDASYYSYSGVTNPVKVMTKGSILYNGTAIDANGVVIHYNKSDGSIDAANGSGKFTFLEANDSIIANVNIVSATGVYFESY